jgi:hypothetical protein
MVVHDDVTSVVVVVLVLRWVQHCLLHPSTKNNLLQIS